MLQRFGLWPVVLVLVLTFGLSAWTAAEKKKPQPVIALCDPAPKFVEAADAPAAPVASGSMEAEAVFKARLPWKPGADVQKTASGLQYVIIAHGDPKGAHPKPVDTVSVLYDGRLAANGKRFDGTEGDDPASFAVNQVIPGWTEGLQLLVPGDQALFYIPANLAYGANSPAAVIPANSDLVFLVTLKKITAAREPYEACWKKATPWKKEAGHKLTKGIQYFAVAEGDKKEPTIGAGDMVSAYLEVRLDDGKRLGGNFGGRPYMGPITNIAPGVEEVLQKMRAGDHWFAALPRDLAFPPGGGPGPDGTGPVVLEVLVNQVMRVPAPSAAPPAGPEPSGPPPAQSTAPPK